MPIESPGSEATVTREDLFPEGWAEQLNAKPEAAEEATEEVAEELAEAQETEQETKEESEAVPGESGKVSAKEFAKAAGWSLEELYRDVYVERNGEEVSLSQAWDDYDNLRASHEALQQERHELQAKVERASTAQPHASPVSPEAQQLAMQAKQYQQALMTPELWAGKDPATAANEKMDYQIQAGHLMQQAQAKQQEWMQARQVEYDKAMSEADKQTRKLIPEWSSPQVKAKEMAAIKDMASGYGFEEAEVDRADPRMRKLLRDAWQAMGKVKQVTEGAKTVRKVARPTLPGGARPGGDGKPKLENVSQRIKDAKTRAEKQRMRLTMPLP